MYIQEEKNRSRKERCWEREVGWDKNKKRKRERGDGCKSKRINLQRENSNKRRDGSKVKEICVKQKENVG
jgi:hypothetical protein